MQAPTYVESTSLCCHTHNITVAQCKPLHVYKAHHYAAPHNITVEQPSPYMCTKHFIMLPHTILLLHSASPYMCTKHFIMLPPHTILLLHSASPYMSTKHFIMLPPPYMCTNRIGIENLFLSISFYIKVDIKCLSNFSTAFP